MSPAIIYVYIPSLCSKYVCNVVLAKELAGAGLDKLTLSDFR
jgi:hypothetical protein